MCEETEGEHGFLLIDARNAFNSINRITMLYVIHHLWPSGARFMFNLYKHWSVLVMRGQDGDVCVIDSREVVTQGDPLSMLGFSVATLPLVWELKRLYPNLLQIWFADDGGIMGSFSEIKDYFRSLV